jgi:uncharacterized protein YbgA (DUF1722 family)
MSRARIGLSKGVLIHFHSQLRLFSMKKAVRDIRVIRWMVATAQPWTEPRARGVKMSKAYIA